MPFETLELVDAEQEVLQSEDAEDTSSNENASNNQSNRQERERLLAAAENWRK